ncbi:MAG: hypothetical protein ABIW82_17400, partial [Dokdonella sp.]
MHRENREAMQGDDNVPTSTNCNLSIGATIAITCALALAAAHVGSVVAATPEQLKPWLGCYEVAISTDERPVDTRILRLTDSPVEGTGG